MKKLYLLLFLFTLSAISCTQNERARNYGGTEDVYLLENEQFVNITWKDVHLWIITHDTVENIYYAREKSEFGILQGKVVIHPSESPDYY